MGLSGFQVKYVQEASRFSRYHVCTARGRTGQTSDVGEMSWWKEPSSELSDESSDEGEMGWWNEPSSESSVEDEGEMA